MKKIKFIIVLFMCIFTFFGCRFNQELYIKSGESCTAEFKTAKEADRKLKWSFRSDDLNTGDLEVIIIVNNKEVFRSMELSGTYEIKDHYSNVKLIVSNLTKNDINTDVEFIYSFLGKAGVASGTAQKRIRLK